MKKRQQLSAITTKRLPSGYQIARRLESRAWIGSQQHLDARRLGNIIAERKRKRRIKELGRKLVKAVMNAERRGYTSLLHDSPLFDPRVKVLQRAYFKALGVK